MVKRSKKSYRFSSNQLPKLLSWAEKHDYFSYLNGNDYQALYGSFPNILFIGKRTILQSTSNSFSKLNKLLEHSSDWLFGYFSYDLKNEIEDLESKKPVSIPFEYMAFYIPEVVIHLESNELLIEAFEDPDRIYEKIISTVKYNFTDENEIGPLSSNTSKWQYLDHIHKIKSSIVEGEFYEMNYCIEFTADVVSFDPISCYSRLNAISPMPFSALLKLGHRYLISASPERFLRKDKNKIISQPVKGTIKRSFDKHEDEMLKMSLKKSEKEQAENMMIVDLVRNDLARSAKAGSVCVDELFGIYTFNKIHQMISTVTAIHKKNVPITDIIKYAFPMGSMTGAPKIRVMTEIERLENSSRGLYSGAVGYFSPERDFDFNVVIRSILFDSKSGKISFHVGSAITYDSKPENEYDECLLKAESLMEVLYGKRD